MAPSDPGAPRRAVMHPLAVAYLPLVQGLQRTMQWPRRGTAGARGRGTRCRWRRRCWGG